jgi:hypothetical protein
MSKRAHANMRWCTRPVVVACRVVGRGHRTSPMPATAALRRGQQAVSRTSAPEATASGRSGRPAAAATPAAASASAAPVRKPPAKGLAALGARSKAGHKEASTSEDARPQASNASPSTQESTPSPAPVVADGAESLTTRTSADAAAQLSVLPSADSVESKTSKDTSALSSLAADAAAAAAAALCDASKAVEPALRKEARQRVQAESAFRAGESPHTTQNTHISSATDAICGSKALHMGASLCADSPLGTTSNGSGGFSMKFNVDAPAFTPRSTASSSPTKRSASSMSQGIAHAGNGVPAPAAAPPVAPTWAAIARRPRSAAPLSWADEKEDDEHSNGNGHSSATGAAQGGAVVSEESVPAVAGVSAEAAALKQANGNDPAGHKAPHEALTNGTAYLAPGAVHDEAPPIEVGTGTADFGGAEAGSRGSGGDSSPPAGDEQGATTCVNATTHAHAAVEVNAAGAGNAADAVAAGAHTACAVAGTTASLAVKDVGAAADPTSSAAAAAGAVPASASQTAGSENSNAINLSAAGGRLLDGAVAVAADKEDCIVSSSTAALADKPMAAVAMEEDGEEHTAAVSTGPAAVEDSVELPECAEEDGKEHTAAVATGPAAEEESAEPPECAEGDVEEYVHAPLELAGMYIPSDAPETEDEIKAEAQLVALAKRLSITLGALQPSQRLGLAFA